ncbi:MAG TPA: hypothetical protein VJU87_01380, partial [Gemmatimonadaceae bacterium]|nr:hypothetical protein [Gemmatimonadaceae bacterium]
GLGPRSTRWFPAGLTGAGGSVLGIALTNNDVVGRLSLLAQGALGFGDAWRGAAVQTAWRGTRPTVRADVFLAREGVPAGFPPAILPGSDLRGLSIRADFAHALDLAQIDGGFGGSIARLSPFGGTAGASAPAPGRRRRDLAFATLGTSARQGSGGATLTEGLKLAATLGRTGRAVTPERYERMLVHGAVSLGGAAPLPLDAEATYGRVSASAPVFERFAVGGPASSLVDPSLLSQRVVMPALPAGVATGERLLAYRMAAPMGAFSPFYWGASVRDGSGRFARWHRVAGLEASFQISPLFVIGTPGARARIGIARSLDAPFARRTRGYAALVLTP